MAAIALAAVPTAWSWSAHSMLTRAALGDGPAMQATVQTEELLDFVTSERAGLAQLLGDIESRASKELPAYAPFPQTLAFDPAAQGLALRESFLRALRVNPAVPLGLYRQPATGEQPSGRPVLNLSDYSLVAADLAGGPIESLRPGESITALDVLATASDEPDYGLDIGLYTNNAGPLGALYGFGEQPFGNPALSYGSQAPFHMAFQHEDPVIALAAPFSRRSQAAYRELQYTSLARYAFAHGHAYWGWRFAGLALHYVQDLAQPYHARMIPGQGTLSTILLNIFGSEADRNGALMLLSNRHLVLEVYAYEALKDTQGASRTLFEAALAGQSGGGTRYQAPTYRRMWLYDVVAMGGYAAAAKLDTIVSHAFPARYVDDPAFDYGLAREQGSDPWDPYPGVVNAESKTRLDTALAMRYRVLGGEIRSYIAYVGDPAAVLHARKTSVDMRGLMYLAALLVFLGGIVTLIIFVRPKRTA
jgi:hypothetical protein